MSDEIGNWCADVDATLASSSRLIAPTDGSPPVVAIVGAVKGGKTSLLKRILHERGAAPDSELIVGGDPTTFCAHDLDFEEMVLRDTPGLGSGRPGHDQAAIDAAVDADATVLVLTPTLLSGTSDATWDVLTGRAWGGAGLESEWQILAVNRFDEGAPDPVTELPAYQARVDRKRNELEESLVKAEVQIPTIIFTSGDPFGEVENDVPDENSYIAGEGWDGLNLLLAWLNGVPPRLMSLRRARAVRVRSVALDERRAELDQKLMAVAAVESDARQRAHSLAEHRRAFDRLWTLADVSLDEALSEAVGQIQATDVPDRGERLQKRVAATLGSWSLALSDDLRQLLDSSAVAIVHEAPPALEDPDLSHLRLGERKKFGAAADLLSKHATHVREATSILSELAQEFPRLDPVTGLLNTSVVDAVIRLVDLFAEPQDDVANRERALSAHRRYLAAATNAARDVTAPLRAWADDYLKALAGASAKLSAERDNAARNVAGARSEVDSIEALQRRATALHRL